MKRGIITIEEKKVSVTGNEVWMTATEIAGLFHASVPAVNAAIKAVRKSDVLNDYEVCRYMRLENGLHADVYALEIIIPHRLPTEHLLHARVPQVAGGEGSCQRKAAGIRDAYPQGKRVLLNTQGHGH